MKLSDLIEQPVVDQHGRQLGQTHDVLLMGEGSMYRIEGLVAGRAAFGTRLGYNERRAYDTETRGPWLVRSIVRAFHRKAIYVPWSAVRAIEAERIVVESPEKGFDRA